MIVNGKQPDSIVKVVMGERVGTLFNVATAAEFAENHRPASGPDGAAKALSDSSALCVPVTWFQK